MKKFIGLAGLHRSGSTLFSSIMDQNPRIHAEGNSALCQLMWDVQNSCNHMCDEQLVATNRFNTRQDIIGALPNLYYKDVKKPVVLDKCRAWTYQDNIEMIYNYTNFKPKIIVLHRPLIEVVKSFMQVHKQNNKYNNPAYIEKSILAKDGPLTAAYIGYVGAKKNNNGEFLFVNYHDMLDDMDNVLDKVYEFIGEKRYPHDLTNIINSHEENDGAYGLKGMHTVRPTISLNEYDIKLDASTLKTIKELESLECES